MKGELIPRWPAFEQSTSPFRTLYQEVNQRLHVRGLALATEEERQWMQFLIDHFEIEYQLWAEKPELRIYLELSDRCIRANPLLSVLAHAYLHVCYDLPRVIADSFTILEPQKA